MNCLDIYVSPHIGTGRVLGMGPNFRPVLELGRGNPVTPPKSQSQLHVVNLSSRLNYDKKGIVFVCACVSACNIVIYNIACFLEIFRSHRNLGTSMHPLSYDLKSPCSKACGLL